MKIFPPRRAVLLDLALVLVAAAFFGAGGGSPFYHPDTLIEKALRTLAQGGDPKFFNYPALLLYLNGFVYQSWLGLLHANSLPVDTYLAAVHSGTAWEQSLFVPGQLITLFFSLIGAASTYLAALRLTRSRVAALASALLLVTCLLWASDAHYLTVDTPLAGLGMATVGLTLAFSEEERPLRTGQLIFLGILAGLTAAAKYNGALVLLSVAAACFFHNASRGQWVKQMVVVGAVSLAVFFATNPYIFLGSPKFFADFQYEMQHARLGHAGFTTENAALFNLQTTLPQAYGWVALGLAAAGLAALLLSRRIAWAQKLGFLAYPLAGFALIGSSHLAFQRYMLPFLPFIAILAVFALFTAVDQARWRGTRLGWAALLLAAGLWLAVVLPNARNVLQSNALLARPDTRAYFVKIIQSSGLSAARGPGFAGQYTDLYFFNNRFRGTQADAERASILVLDSFSHDRWLYDLNTRLELRQSNFAADYTVVQITPYTRPKAEVPLSPQSIYSPYLPDLYDRALPGPYIEIYLREPALIEALMQACQQSGAPCARCPANEGFYFQQAMK